MRLGAGWDEGDSWENMLYRTGSVAVGMGTLFRPDPSLSLAWSVTRGFEAIQSHSLQYFIIVYSHPVFAVLLFLKYDTGGIRKPLCVPLV